jgi:hypothetical protein
VRVYYYCVCVYYCSTYYKAVRMGGGGGTMEDMCDNVLRGTTSRGLCGLVCPSRTSVLLFITCAMCVFITAGPITKLFAGGGGGQ